MKPPFEITSQILFHVSEISRLIGNYESILDPKPKEVLEIKNALRLYERFWQTLILSEYEEIFKYLPIESLIEKNQKDYYEILEICDKKENSTKFIEFMLTIILQTLREFISSIANVKIDFSIRIEKARNHFKDRFFSKRDYFLLFKIISSPTASRDLKNAVDRGELKTFGTKNQTKYKFNA